MARHDRTVKLPAKTNKFNLLLWINIVLTAGLYLLILGK